MQNVILLACGSFNPPTIAHIRMMELAKKHVQSLGLNVIAGFFSPVHDAYDKPGLAPSHHRMNMLKLAVGDSPWLDAYGWEALRHHWTPTVHVMLHLTHWYPKYRVMLVAGSDICKSFNVPDLWLDADLRCICSNQHGLILIERVPFEESMKELDKNPVTSKLLENIYFVHQPVRDDISSTKVRMLNKSGQKIEHLVPAGVAEYIKRNLLYKE